MDFIEVVVPVLSESVAEASLLSWLKHAGAFVQADETLLQLETDKVVLDIPAPASGVLTDIFIQENSTVKAGDVLARIDKSAKPTTQPAAASSAESGPGSSVSPKSAPPGGSPPPPTAPAASPAAAKILTEQGIEPETVAGSGRGGRITKQDALEASQSFSSAASTNTTLTSAASSTSPAQALQGRPEQRVPMSRLRARVAERLVQSQQENAILTTFNEVNMQAVINLRNKYKEKFEKEYGVKLGFMSFFVKAAVSALKKYPVLNASIDGRDIIYHGYFDIGIAVGSPRGLVVPILRDVDHCSIAQIEKSIADFGKRAAEGKLGIEEITGGTFSISNGGVFGSMLSTPIINPPQSAILGIHATKERPVVEHGQIVIRPINYLALSYDHRLIDGREAVLSLVAIKEALEDPQRLLLDL
jgi:2-oxoglutarate dehydrogenase E2 component (dihydrolipoamide succinyltransferase)